MNSISKVIVSIIIWGSLDIFVKNINLPFMETDFLRTIIARGNEDA